MFTLTFQITTNCNLICSYCYQNNKQNHNLQLSIAKYFLNSFINNRYSNYININNINTLILEFIGGEPFLQVKLIDDILEYFQSLQFQKSWIIQITTNGTLNLKPEVQKFLKKWKNHLSLTISFDGNKEFHNSCRKDFQGNGTYNQVLQAVLNYYQLFNIFPNNKITISPDNLKYLSSSVISLFELGYNFLPANCIHEHKWTILEAQIYYQELKEIADYLLIHQNKSTTLFDYRLFHPLKLKDKTNYCGGNGRMLAIDWKGDLYPCLRYMESSIETPYIIGNYKDGITRDCKELKAVNRVNQSSIKCLLCPVAAGCPYCQAYNYSLHNDFKHRSVNICQMHKARALANIYYWNKLSKINNLDKKFLFWLSKKDALKLIGKKELKQFLNETF